MSDAPLVPRRRAAALRYVPGETPAPEVVATGEGALAERIIALAREHGIPIHESPDLVKLLTQLPPDTAIPMELYRAVAEVIAFLLRTAAPR
ncbi:EscU/YscU/HrcU family type III secretion system export apparatus switch protein [Luteitalea sp.]|jgi:flagellar biosynthesis protein|uniref:EscU/YscU/HrcU family type III secretion system export apparatus switch protein n=1 Tax=Luteitalea sp. TaxID=2004800 RepID=UPI0037C9405A